VAVLNRAWDAVADRLVASLNDAGVGFELVNYGGWCSFEAAEELAEKAQRLRVDEIVGVGGGKIMDLATIENYIVNSRHYNSDDPADRVRLREAIREMA